MSYLPNALFTLNLENNEFWTTYAAGTYTQKHGLGQLAYDTWGREWVFCCQTAADLTVGQGVSPRALLTGTAGHVLTDVAAKWYDGDYYAVGQIITVDDQTFTAGDLENCIGVVQSGTGAGQVFRIRKNGTLSLYLEAALATALTVAGNSLIKILNGNPFKTIKLPGASVFDRIVGVAQCAVAYATKPYFWALRKGSGFGVVNNATVDPGVPLSPSANTAGEFDLITTSPTGLEDAKWIGNIIDGYDADDNIALVDFFINF